MARKTSSLKKWTAVVSALVYVQVNVAWAGMPNLPLAAMARSSARQALLTFRIAESLSRLIHPSNHVFVFHDGPGISIEQEEEEEEAERPKAPVSSLTKMTTRDETGTTSTLG